jgi:hypothetical protein
MRPALLTILLLLISLTAGCGSASPRVRREIALLRGEIVDLENQYYALKSMYRDETGREPDFSAYGMNNPGRQSGRWLEGGEASGVCLDCGQVHDPRQQYDHPLTIDSRSPSSSPTPAPREGTSQSGELRPGESTIVEPEEPLIEFGPEEVPLPGDDQTNGFRRPASQVGLETPSDAVRPGSRSAQTGSRPAPRSSGTGSGDFEIDSRQTRGFDSDGFPGDEGVMVRLLSRTETGVAGSLGELTFSVIDPDQPQQTQRLGLWKYSAEEVAGMVRQDGNGLVVDARLPWQRGPVRNENLLLFVRLRTPDGRMIERSASFTVTSPDSAAADVQDGTPAEGDPMIEPQNQADRNAPSWRPIR